MFDGVKRKVQLFKIEREIKRLEKLYSKSIEIEIVDEIGSKVLKANLEQIKNSYITSSRIHFDLNLEEEKYTYSPKIVKRVNSRDFQYASIITDGHFKPIYESVDTPDRIILKNINEYSLKFQDVILKRILKRYFSSVCGEKLDTLVEIVFSYISGRRIIIKEYLFRYEEMNFILSYVKHLISFIEESNRSYMQDEDGMFFKKDTILLETEYPSLIEKVVSLIDCEFMNFHIMEKK